MRRFIISLTSLFVVGAVAILIVGHFLAAPNQVIIGPPPQDIPVEILAIEQENGPTIGAWLVSAEQQQAGILLLHSVRSNRREMMGRTRFLYKAGYTVLMIDMQGHGETLGDNITFGLRESEDVLTALKYLRARLPNKPIGVIGTSLGGAAALLGDGPVDADAVVLEAVFSSIEQAIDNRLVIRFGSMGKMLTPLMMMQIQPRLGFSTEELSPLATINKLKSPVLIISGSQDQHTLVSESQSLLANASEPKYLWIIEGAKHQNLHTYSPTEYEQRILDFFHKHLFSNL